MNFEQVGQKVCLNSLLGNQMGVPSIILVDLSGPWMICQVRRNRVPISKHDHVLWVPSSFSELVLVVSALHYSTRAERGFGHWLQLVHCT